MKINLDCKYFKGDVPCKPHKKDGHECEKCPEYSKFDKKILIIKLGARGDVIRTTPILRKLKEAYPNSEITWISDFPELVPKLVDNRLKFDFRNILRLMATKFDILYSFDKDQEACALANIVKADKKKGFFLKDGKCAPIDKDAEHKFLTGLNDELSLKNKLSYPEEIFQIAGFSYSKEKYILDKPDETVELNLNKPIIGFNTGCGVKWKARLWPEKNWVELAKKLKEKGFNVLLLGGEPEHEKNLRISKESDATYLGVFPFNKFISLIDQCDLVVTAVTMTMHIVIGLGKKIVLFNNMFNTNEFELFGLGEIIEPEPKCPGCYKYACEDTCMENIKPEKVADEVSKLIKNAN